MKQQHQSFMVIGLGIALAVATLLSPWASSQPDGLDRVAQDQGFEAEAMVPAPAQKLPFYQVFDQYALRGSPEAIAPSLAGLVGACVCFGLAWGLGKLATAPPQPNPLSRRVRGRE
jgi:cobalt/nickel transport protein